MTDAVAAARRYRFAPLERGGVILGCDLVQCVVLGAGLLTSAFLARAVVVPIAALPLVAGALVAFARVAGRPVREWIPVVTSWRLLRAREVWCATVPLLGTASTPSLPPFLAGIELLEVEAPEWVRRQRVGAVGVLLDERAHKATAVLRVAGREFSLAERSEQDRMVAAWGAALAVFCRERSPVARVTWTECVAPAKADEHRAFVREHAVEAPGRAEYLALVDDARSFSARHDVLVTVTVDERRLRPGRERAARGDALIAALLEEVRLFTHRCTEAGLAAEAPMAPESVTAVLRGRLDPARAAAPVAAGRWGPMAVQPAFESVRVDDTVHRAYWVAEWPRLEQPADWLAPLALHGTGTRALTVVYEPVPVSRSARGVARDAIRLQADEDQRRRGGFRIGAPQRRAQQAVAEREAELVAGFVELRYAGFVVVSAPERATLDERSAEIEQTAARVGLDLRPLHAQHDLGLAATLPIARYPSPAWRS